MVAEPQAFRPLIAAQQLRDLDGRVWTIELCPNYDCSAGRCNYELRIKGDSRTLRYDEFILLDLVRTYDNLPIMAGLMPAQMTSVR